MLYGVEYNNSPLHVCESREAAESFIKSHSDYPIFHHSWWLDYRRVNYNVIELPL